MIKNMDRGILFMLLSALISALNGAVAKILSEDFTALEIVFYRNLLGMTMVLYTLKHTAPILKGGKFHLLFLRGVFGASAMVVFFYTITVIPLGEAITLNKTSPFFVSILAFYLMKEHLSKKAMLALAIGFFGIILITKPWGLSISYAHFLGILGGFFAAAAYATIKKIKDIYDTRIIMLSFMGVGTLFPLVLFILSFWVKNPPDYLAFLFTGISWHGQWHLWALVIFMAFISTLSQYFLTKAYSFSKASIIGVISYTNIPFSIGFGWMLGDAFPDFWTFTGIGLIVLGGILVGKSK